MEETERVLGGRHHHDVFCPAGSDLIKHLVILFQISGLELREDTQMIDAVHIYPI